MAAGTKSWERLIPDLTTLEMSIQRMRDEFAREVRVVLSVAHELRPGAFPRLGLALPPGLFCPLCEHPLEWSDSVRDAELPRFGAGVLVTVHARCR